MCYHHDLESFLLKAVEECVSHKVMWAIGWPEMTASREMLGPGISIPSCPSTVSGGRELFPAQVSKLVSGVRFSMHHTAVQGSEGSLGTPEILQPL